MNYSLQEVELYLFNKGSNAYSYRALGCHSVFKGGQKSHRFAVWAPNAINVSVVGDFNQWDPNANPMKKLEKHGVWETHIENLCDGALYKYHITGADGKSIYKADPFAFFSELRPGTASKVWNLDGYNWNDGEWVRKRRKLDPYASPISIYEMHLASWRGEKNYREIAAELPGYLKEMGYTHVEFMPLSEHPFDGSWGYQVTGFFSATARYGTPQDLMYLIDTLHDHGIGVIIDWVPAHFPRDAHGLRMFDGSPCFEHPDIRRAEQPDWGTMIFNFEKTEVLSFLMSSAIFWLDVFHVDGLRADAISSILYLNYSKNDGEWLPNQHGGHENLEAIAFLQKCSETVFRDFPGTLFCAEESTSWPLVTAPTDSGGLGFNFKWNMGWMHDTLQYMSLDPYFRSKNQNKLTFSMCYAFSENYILPLSHDEVVHGKLSLLSKMPGEYEQKFANLRVFMAFMFAHPGKKLMFMGAEIGEFIEWRFYESLEWHLLDYEAHRKFQHFVKSLNKLYQKTPALYEIEKDWDGFTWLCIEDEDNSIIAFARMSKIQRNGSRQVIVCVFNFTPVAWDKYRIGVPLHGCYQEIFSASSREFGGGSVKGRTRVSEEKPWNDQPHSIEVRIPPFGGLYLEFKEFSPKQLLENKIKTEAAELKALENQAEKLKKEHVKASKKAAEAQNRFKKKQTDANKKSADSAQLLADQAKAQYKDASADLKKARAKFIRLRARMEKITQTKDNKTSLDRE